MPPAFLFSVQPASGVPIYRQLIEQVLLLSASGRLEPGDFLPSVRQVADEVAVNPMTVSKAYSLLERDGVVELVRGQGMRLLAAQPRATMRARLEELAPLLDQIAARARQLAIAPEIAVEELRKRCERLTKEVGDGR